MLSELRNDAAMVAVTPAIAFGPETVYRKSRDQALRAVPKTGYF